MYDVQCMLLFTGTLYSCLMLNKACRLTYDVYLYDCMEMLKSSDLSTVLLRLLLGSTEFLHLLFVLQLSHRSCIFEFLCLSESPVAGDRRWYFTRPLSSSMTERFPSTYPMLCFKEIPLRPEIKGVFLGDFVLNTRVRKFRHGTSINGKCCQLSSSHDRRQFVTLSV